MKILIIEDEKVTAKDLALTIKQLYPFSNVVATLGTVKESISYFRNGTDADLVFSDIQLGDGLSFEIFSKVAITIPVIFCTAFDEYALQAFGANGIDYILKPFTTETVAGAIQKYLNFRGQFAENRPPYEALEQIFALGKKQDPGAVLVFYKDKILPVAIHQIAYFYLNKGVVQLTTFEQKCYSINKNMEELGKITAPLFFRTSRQFLVNRKAVKEASNYLSRKLSVSLSVPVSETITVSKEKMQPFLEWLTQS